jgi:predicted Zn-dependent protease
MWMFLAGNKMKNLFLDMVKVIQNNITGEEKFTAWFSAEELDYARFNHAKIRQGGSVLQQYLIIDLIKAKRHANITIGLTKNAAKDKEKIIFALKKLRDQIAKSKEDPFLMIHEGNVSTENTLKNELLNKEEIVNIILKQSAGLDLVGCYLGGPIYKGFANSFGQIHWFAKSSFVLDTSVYHKNDKAIKQNYADVRFNPETWLQKIENTRFNLKLFDKESLNIKTGSYRVYFSPYAVNEIISLLNWGGFSRKSLEVKNSPLLPLYNQQKVLSKSFSISENLSSGIGPKFQPQGFIKPDFLPIIENGQLINTMISPKTAKEYCLAHNGANEEETMYAIDMKGGDLLDQDILATLKDGLYINNLWYLNFSDRQNGRLTGMTRFFCYVIKNQQPVAPFNVMRFDDSIYRIFGENLRHITKHRELIIDNATYDERSTSCAQLPGIIVENVRFTL